MKNKKECPVVLSPEDLEKLDYNVFTLDSDDPDDWSFEFNKNSDSIKMKFKDNCIVLNKSQINNLISFIKLTGLFKEINSKNYIITDLPNHFQTND